MHMVTRYRLENGNMTKAELSRRTKVSWRRIFEIERGKEKPSAKTARDLHKGTNGGIDAAKLLGLDQLPAAHEAPKTSEEQPASDSHDEDAA